MQKHMYTLKDTKVGIYLTPFFTYDDENAVRDCTIMVNDDSHPIGQNPHGRALYRLGSYDDENGSFNLYDAPQHMVNLEDLKKG
jgi:hypothetical protein